MFIWMHWAFSYSFILRQVRETAWTLHRDQEKVILVWDRYFRSSISTSWRTVFEVWRNKKQFGVSYSKITIVPWAPRVYSYEPNLTALCSCSVEFGVLFSGFRFVMYIYVCVCVWEPLSLRVPVHVHQELTVSNGVLGSEAGREGRERESAA